MVYQRLRGSTALRAETEDTRRWICQTPPWCYLAPLLIPALPVIADLTAIINALLWPAEKVIRPRRTRPSRPGGDRS
jgi:hypothetical protein